MMMRCLVFGPKLSRKRKEKEKTIELLDIIVVSPRHPVSVWFGFNEGRWRKVHHESKVLFCVFFRLGQRFEHPIKIQLIVTFHHCGRKMKTAGVGK